MYRGCDLILSIVGIICSSPLLILIGVIVFIEVGSPLFFQTRLSQKKKPFVLVKFRTMVKAAPSVASHLIDKRHITVTGKFLRRTKLDELPQLWNVLAGDMSIVGPRPCLQTQVVVIQERDKRDVFSVKPGITGLSQICRVDMAYPKKMARLDALMIKKLSFKTYFHLILATLFPRCM